MAKHKLSAMFSDMRGKLNGSKFSKSRSAHTLTNWVKPRNPQTARQMNVRTKYLQLSKIWRTLTEAQLLSWNEFAKETILKNIFGDSHNPSGFNAFMSINTKLLNFGYDWKAIPPRITPVDNPKIRFKLDPVTQNMLVELDDDCPEFMKIGISASVAHSTGRTYINKNTCRRIVILDNTTVFPYNFKSDYKSFNAKTILLGQRICKIIVFNWMEDTAPGHSEAYDWYYKELVDLEIFNDSWSDWMF